MLSCDECRIAKKKCDRTSPCSRCTEKNVNCTYNAKKYRNEVVPKRLKLELRLKKLEHSLLNYIEEEHNIKIELPKFEKSVLPNYDVIFGDEICVSPPSSSSSHSSSSSFNIHLIRTISSNPNDQVNYTIPLSYLKQLLQTYLEGIDIFYPFINISFVNQLFETCPHTSPLLNAIYCLSEVTQHRLNNINPLPLLESSYFYQIARQLIKLKENSIDLEIVQALFLLAKVELELGLFISSNRHLVEGVRKLQMMAQDESDPNWRNTWAIACKIDTTIEVSANIPPLIRLKSEHFLESQYMIGGYADESSQLLNLYTKWAYLMQQLHYLRRQVNAKSINVEEFIESYHDIEQYLFSHPFYGLDGAKFLELFNGHRYFSGYLSNYIIYQVRIINFEHTTKVFMQDHISIELENAAIIGMTKLCIDNLSKIIYSDNLELQQLISSFIKLDYSFVLGYYMLYLGGDEVLSKKSKVIFDNTIGYWPTLSKVQQYQRPSGRINN